MKKFAAIMVPVEGAPADEQAIRLACRIARQDKSKVLAVYVIEVQRTLPLDAENVPQLEHGEQVLEHAELIAKETGIQIETELLQSRAAGPTLVDEAAERGVDLIIMGIPPRHSFGEAYLSTTPAYVMRNAVCQVWLCRQEMIADGTTSQNKK